MIGLVIMFWYRLDLGKYRHVIEGYILRIYSTMSFSVEVYAVETNLHAQHFGPNVMSLKIPVPTNMTSLQRD